MRHSKVIASHCSRSFTSATAFWTEQILVPLHLASVLFLLSLIEHYEAKLGVHSEALCVWKVLLVFLNSVTHVKK